MYILGISAYSHDSAASLIHNDDIIASVQEERFTRIKGDDSFPFHSIKYCLETAGIELSQVDSIIYYEKPWLTFDRIIQTYIRSSPRGLRSFLMSIPMWLNKKLNIRALIQKELVHFFSIHKNKLPEILFSSHHLSHAASAFFPSPFEKAAVICLDGVGEWATVSLWKGEKNTLIPLWEISFPHSLGLLYSAFTWYCGFKVNSGEYKLMGLAPFGTPRFQDLIEKELIDILEDGSFRMNMYYFDYCHGFTMTNIHFERLFGVPPRKDEGPMEQIYMDMAASIQSVTNKIMLRLAKTIKLETGMSNLCISGGVGLNCVANGLISSSNLFEQIFIQPASGDAGSALGAALAGYHMHFKKSREALVIKDKMSGSLLGPDFSDESILLALKKFGLNFHKESQISLCDKASNYIIEQKIIGWFQGRMEFGPRALGNRSILADPRNPNMKSIMNLKIKFREGFRPFAPAILESEFRKHFDFNEASPYMLLTATSLDPSRFSAVTHLDQSSRLQTVTPEHNPLFHNLISAFFEKSGCPALINTSFNIRGEPIVCTPLDAINCFINTDIDALAIGSYWLTKEENTHIQKNKNWVGHFAKD